MVKLSEEFKELLESKISQLESKTSVEIIPVFESSAAFYAKYPFTFIWPSVFLPKFLKPKDLSARAHQIFLKRELFKTKYRNALMIFVSEGTHSVYLLADQGLAEKMNSSLWNDLGNRLAADFNSSKPGDSFLNALKELESELVRIFPADANNPNELSNKIIEVS